MPRRRTVHLNLPEGIRPRVWSNKPGAKTHYYLEAAGKTIKLGTDYLEALRKYCELVQAAERPAVTWLAVVKRYQTEALLRKAPKTQADELSRLKCLNKFFEDDPRLDQIQPRHLRLYQQWRLDTMAAAEASRRKDGKPPTRKGDGKIAVNREITLFSTIWQWARTKDYTRQECPARDVERFPEKGRKDVYIEDDILAAVYEAGDQALRDVLDLAYLTGQRRADVLAMTEAMIRPAKHRQPDGSSIDVRTIPVKQEKTGNKVRMILDGELGKLIDRIQTSKRAHKVISLALLVTESGERLTAQMLRGRFEKARRLAAEAAEARGALDMARDIRRFQFRDLRAKAGSDKAEETGSMIEAQKLLGHSAASTTEIYVRHRRGALVKPTR
jgi:integrase